MSWNCGFVIVALLIHGVKDDKYGALVNDYRRKTGGQRLTRRIANLSTTNTRWVAVGFNPGLQVEKPGKWPQLWHGQCLLRNEETA